VKSRPTPPSKPPRRARPAHPTVSSRAGVKSSMISRRAFSRCWAGGRGFESRRSRKFSANRHLLLPTQTQTTAGFLSSRAHPAPERAGQSRLQPLIPARRMTGQLAGRLPVDAMRPVSSAFVGPSDPQRWLPAPITRKARTRRCVTRPTNDTPALRRHRRKPPAEATVPHPPATGTSGGALRTAGRCSPGRPRPRSARRALPYAPGRSPVRPPPCRVRRRSARSRRAK
jgi:hypothetical protein